MKYTIRKEGDNTIYRQKIDSQVVELVFTKWDCLIGNYYWTCLFINKRGKGYKSEHQTGKVGLSGLLAAKQMLLNFIEELKKQKGHNVLLVGWANKRRKNVYWRSLREYGFKFSRFIDEDCLKSDIN